MQVFNNLFGEGMTSRLFMNLREKQSLCYSVGSNYYGAKGIVTVSAGIDCGKKEAASQEILAQLECCRRGEFTPEELNAAKQALLSGLRATHDSPSAIESYYAGAALSGLRWTPEEYMQKIQGVTPEQVRRAAESLKLHTRYSLTERTGQND